MLIIFKILFPLLHRFYCLPLSFPVTFLHTPWLLYGRITSSPPLCRTGLTVPARLPVLVLSWVCCVSVTLLPNNNKWLFKKGIPIPYIFLHLSTFPFHSLFCITHHALNHILKKSHIFHKLHCLFMVCKKICKGQFCQYSFRNHLPLSMVQLWHIPHPPGILRVPEISSAIPLITSAHFSTHVGTTSYSVGNQ